MKKYKSYKVFDGHLRCRGYQYEVGKKYRHDGAVDICENGFHSCLTLADCFDYYDFDPKNRVCEVQIWGEMDCELVGNTKVASEYIFIARELSWHEVLTLCNTGHYNAGLYNTGHLNTGTRNTGTRNTGHLNTGYCNTGSYNTGDYNTGNSNTGDYNTGYRNTGEYNTGGMNAGHGNAGDCNTGYYNTGDYNTGIRNTGNYNTGNYNTGNYNTGYFNTTTDEHIIVFNNFRVPKSEFTASLGYAALQMLEIDMRNIIDTESFYAEHRAAWALASKKTRRLIQTMPGFDAEIFKQCTGIDVNEEI